MDLANGLKKTRKYGISKIIEIEWETIIPQSCSQKKKKKKLMKLERHHDISLGKSQTAC